MVRSMTHTTTTSGLGPSVVARSSNRAGVLAALPQQSGDDYVSRFNNNPLPLGKRTVVAGDSYGQNQ